MRVTLEMYGFMDALIRLSKIITSGMPKIYINSTVRKSAATRPDNEKSKVTHVGLTLHTVSLIEINLIICHTPKGFFRIVRNKQGKGNSFAASPAC